MKTLRLPALFYVLTSMWLLAHSSGFAQPRAAASDPVPVDIAVPFAPIPVLVAGKANLLYELHITNFSANSLALTGVEVRDAARAALLGSYRGNELLGQVAVLNFTADKQAKNVLAGGQRAIVFMLLTCPPAQVPAALQHRLFFKSAEAADSAKSEQVVDYAGVIVQPAEVPVLGPPVRGRWLAGNGLSNNSNHRRSIKIINGRAYIAQRFATDWIKIGEDGLLARNGDLSQNANYYGYGAQALAVANATVVAVQDGLPENVPQTKKRAVDITLETIAGNSVLLDLGKGRYALYAHLQPQSLKVKVGDKVKAGQVLGLVGNSGNSDLPHLHFQVTNAASPLGAEGVPYVLRAYLMQGIIPSAAEVVKGGFKPASSEDKRQLEIPVQNAVVVLP